jgi:hypothetical protein
VCALAPGYSTTIPAVINWCFDCKIKCQPYAEEGETMLAEIRQEARAAEEAALAAALQAACLQVPVDVAGLRANLQRARGVLEREDRLAALALAAEIFSGSGSIVAGVAEDTTSLINMVYNDPVKDWDEVGGCTS